MDKKPPTAWMWDYDGACAPGSHWTGMRTFSVGIFQWVPKSSGKGLKRSKVRTRVRGYIHSPDEVYARAQEICDELNNAKEKAHQEYAMSKTNESTPQAEPIEGKRIESTEELLRLAVEKAKRMTVEEYEKLYDESEPIPGPTMESPTKQERA